MARVGQTVAIRRPRVPQTLPGVRVHPPGLERPPHASASGGAGGFKLCLSGTAQCSRSPFLRSGWWSIQEFLQQLGISGDKLKTISYGKERPQCTESNEDCWQKNRRVHFSAQ